MRAAPALNDAVRAAGPQTEAFTTASGRVFGYIVMGCAAVVIIFSLATDPVGSRALEQVALAFALIAWAILVRPKVAAHERGLLMRNLVHDTFVPWDKIKGCRAAQTLQVSTRDAVFNGVGLSKSPRTTLREQRRAARGGQQPMNLFGLGRQYAMRNQPPLDTPRGTFANPVVERARQQQVGGSYFDYVEQRVGGLADQAPANPDSVPVVSWSLAPIVALLVAAAAVAFIFV
ncbi:MAG TPA: PH domain-containing protein [Nocardioidaceae bacterium]|nr:PH domain-containing protein [Nocardioidaceae bacterium]